jgi:hypothetical protein
MPRETSIGRPGQFDEFRRYCIQRLERAALIASDRAAAAALRDLRAAMAGAGLGRLGNALGYGSDLKKGRGVHRRGAEGFSASGWVYIRSRSERAVGAITAYTEGAEITPKKSPWLWISTDEIPRLVGRRRMTPALYRSGGLESRIGPLVQIAGRHGGEALLIVRNVTVDRFGRAGKAKALPKRGAVGSSRERKDFIVAFVGIRRTSRSARVHPREIMSLQQARLPEYRAAALASDGFER